MGVLRRPGQQAGAEPGEEEEHGLEGGEAGAQAVFHDEGDGQGGGEEVVVVQVRAGEGGEDEQRGDGAGLRGGGDGGEGDGRLDEQSGMQAERAGQGEYADEAGGEFMRLAGEQHVAHGRAGEVDEAGPGGGAEGGDRGIGEQHGSHGGVGKGGG